MSHSRLGGLAASSAVVVIALCHLAGARASRPCAPRVRSTAHVHGRVLVNGEPMAGWHVILLHDPWIGIPPQVDTRPDGTFDLGRVPCGPSWIRVDIKDPPAVF